MDNFDEELEKILRKDVETPLNYEYAIKNALSKKETCQKRNLIYRIALTVGCLVMGCTCVMAASLNVYEKIWKEPVIVNEDEQEELVSKVQEEITEQEKKDFISEENAISIANTVLSQLEFEGREVTSVNLERGYDLENGYHYLLRSDSILIQINPKSGELEYFSNKSILNNDIKCDDVSEEYIKQIATNIYQKFGIIESKDNYEIVSAKRQNIAFREHINDLWQISFGKVYNNQYDENNVFTICLAICNGKTVIASINGKTNVDLDNNPIIISKEDAIEIAINKEKEFSELEIKSVETSLSIEKMNIFIFCLENNTDNSDGKYKVDDISRNVWVVTVKHNKDSKPKDGELETVRSLYDKKYYIDTTTGEIIGGEQAEFFNN